ncbi:MAG TPA: SLBB domain-containing protein, partial [Gammaproteobacteria bacterium]|nr:SLBB domain-containing protein [Gammaproteobacteria bacterium]
FVGQSTEQIRVVGAAAQPQSIPYRARMTVLDLMIAVGGLNQFAAGNSAQLIRTVDGERKKIPVRLEDLLNEGEIEANRRVLPGDILIIPEAWF